MSDLTRQPRHWSIDVKDVNHSTGEVTEKTLEGQYLASFFEAGDKAQAKIAAKLIVERNTAHCASLAKDPNVTFVPEPYTKAEALLLAMSCEKDYFVTSKGNTQYLNH